MSVWAYQAAHEHRDEGTMQYGMQRKAQRNYGRQ